MDSQTTAWVADALGWVAAGLTLLTFVSGEMRRLRLLALAANAAFIGYGALAGLLPVLVLHLALVPVNLWRLNQTLRGRTGAEVPPRSAPTRRPRGGMPTPRVQRVARSEPDRNAASVGADLPPSDTKLPSAHRPARRA